MNRTNEKQWKDNVRKPFFERPTSDFPADKLNPVLLKVDRRPVKDLPFYFRHAKKVQITIVSVAMLILFSKPLYDVYNHYFGEPKPIKRADIQLHPKVAK
jgi:hypothetical protein